MQKTRAEALGEILTELGAVPAQARAWIEAGRAARGGADPPGAVATLHELVSATDVLGATAHRILGHVPDAADDEPPAGETAPAGLPPPDADALLARLAFLHEHIVSTIDIQSAAVWQQPAEDGRPLQAYAEALAETDAALLARLRELAAG